MSRGGIAAISLIALPLQFGLSCYAPGNHHLEPSLSGRSLCPLKTSPPHPSLSRSICVACLQLSMSREASVSFIAEAQGESSNASEPPSASLSWGAAGRRPCVLIPPHSQYLQLHPSSQEPLLCARLPAGFPLWSFSVGGMAKLQPRSCSS